ncbi:hypothetical protein BC826DRAFT_1109385 [Russula brevipes]|nr:hypothetical protein BC826DRAFT_1109385 [Russula brevipes]
MAADFVSADYGWLRSPDGKESARVLFRAGKAHDGYFDNENIRAQAACAMDILTRHYSHEDHVLVFDNATTHRKQAVESLSASKMTKGPLANFLVDINAVDEARKPLYGPNGKILKRKVRMENGKFKDGTEQVFYHPEGHKYAGQFKASSKDKDLEKNVVQALDKVPLISMRQFSNRSLRFMFAYQMGLDGSQAAWAAKMSLLKNGRAEVLLSKHGNVIAPEDFWPELDDDALDSM